MNDVGSRSRRRLTVAIRASLRDLHTQLSLLNHHIGTRVELKDVELDCLDLLDQHGALSPSALAKLAGLHPATLTGILDRLERAGWLRRDRDTADRRAVVIRPVRDRGAEVLRLYGGMNGSLSQIFATYNENQLELLADFLRRAADAGRQAAGDLAGGTP